MGELADIPFWIGFLIAWYALWIFACIVGLAIYPTRD